MNFRRRRLADRTTTSSVVIVGAGPAGLTIALLLRAAGVDCVVIEAAERSFIEQRPGAGFIEEWAVRALSRRGLAARLWEGAQTHRDAEFRLDGDRFLFPYGDLTGHRHFVCPQPVLVTELVRAYADDSGGDIRFGVADVQLHRVDTDRPAVSYTDSETGERRLITCEFIAGCDGARGVTRRALPEGAVSVFRHDLGVGWLALLAEAPPSSQRVVFGLHPRGFAAHMARSPEVTRYYLECPPDDTVDNWPHERIWDELRERLHARDATPLIEGTVIEKRVLAMHNYVVEPMAHGRLYLAGDAAHLLAPIAAKGMNLALHDAFLLADALTAHYGRGGGAGLYGYEDNSGLTGYSEAALRLVWQYQEFTQWFSDVMHGPSSGDPYRAGVAVARLRRMTGSPAAAASVAGLYIGQDADY